MPSGDDIRFNQVINGQKQGRWIQYDFTDIERIIIGHWDGVDEISGESISGSYKIGFAYGPMSKKEEIENNGDEKFS